MKTAGWIVFGLCAAFMLVASAFDVVRTWSVFVNNPWGFSYLVPGNAATPGVPYFAFAIRSLIPMVVAIGALFLTVQRALRGKAGGVNG